MMLEVTAIAFSAVLCAPHDGPARRIDALTRRIAKVGRTSDLLFQRALCYVELRKHRSALVDIQGALELDPRHEGALVERVRVFASLRKPDAALESARQARPVLRTVAIRALLAGIEAQILTTEKRYEAAAARLDAALGLVPDQPGVVLHRSILRGLLDQQSRRVRELRMIVGRTGANPVVESAWVDALIDARDFEGAQPIVEARLRDSRFRSTWLLARARIHRGTGRRDRAEADLLAALRELTGRIRPGNPDLLLVADRAAVLHLLGHEQAARADVELLRARRYPVLLQLRLALLMRD